MAGNPFYNTPEWRACRAAEPAANPTCEVPGCGKRASYVDHIRSLASGGAAFDPRNLMSLDHSCHSRKTVAKDGGFGRKLDGVLRGKPGCDANGTPVDPGHCRNTPKTL